MSFKPLRMSSSVSMISGLDPAIDWEACAQAELELPENEALRNAVEVDAAGRQRAALALFGARVGNAAVKNPAATLELYKLKPGETATLFEIGVLHPDELVRIEDECKVGTPDVRRKELHWRCFLAGLRDVKGLGGDPDFVAPKRKVGDIEYVDQPWLRRTFIRGLRPVALDVGSMTFVWNQFTEDDAKN